MSVGYDTDRQTIATNDDGARQSATLPFDPAKYAAEVDEFDLTEAQKLELLTTLWSIMRSFVELGFSVDVCGHLLDGLTPGPGDDD